MSCSGCHATVYPEHIDRHLAGYWAGALYCAHCLAEMRNPITPAPPSGEAAPLVLEDAEPAPTAGPAASAEPTPVGRTHVGYHPPRPGATGATRLRIFHARLSEGAVGHLEQQINAWLESHPEVEVKFAETTVGVWEGKHAEPNLIVTLFY
jgi:hypothetical protein